MRIARQMKRRMLKGQVAGEFFLREGTPGNMKPALPRAERNNVRKAKRKVAKRSRRINR